MIRYVTPIILVAALVPFIGCGQAPFNPSESTTATKPGRKVVRILFVCIENSNRSQMAEAFARMYGGDRVEAFSAGSKPSGRVNPKAIAAMQELGYDLTPHTSKGIEQFNGQDMDATVTMGCGDACPLVKGARQIDWQIPDPKALPPEEFNSIRDMIGGKVKTLLAELGVPER